VAAIFDHGQTESHAYIVMEYLAGGELRSQMEQPLPPPQALDYLAQICEALMALHAAGIVHRDLSRRICCCARTGRWCWPTSALPRT
jgi:serine/threonine-protein kinase